MLWWDKIWTKPNFSFAPCFSLYTFHQHFVRFQWNPRSELLVRLPTSLRPTRAGPSQVGIKLGISVVAVVGPAGWDYRHHQSPPITQLLFSSQPGHTQTWGSETTLETGDTNTSIMMSWTCILLLVCSYSQASNGFRIKISEEISTENCQQTLTNLEVSDFSLN